jgi:DNA repair protein RadD
MHMPMKRLALQTTNHTPLKPRPYQEDAVNSLWDFLINKDGNPLVVCPTGTGKALIICLFVQRVMLDYPDCRILVLTHAKELVAQNYKEMIELWPNCPAGINNAGLGKRDVSSTVIFGSIQSMHKSAFALQRVDIVLVDEAQSIPRDENTMWLKFFNDVNRINGNKLRVAGLTATDYRLDSGRLTDGDDAMFDEVCYEYSIIEAIKDGYLACPKSEASETQIDTTGVGVRGGEFIPGQLEAVAMDPQTVDSIAEEICRKGANRHGWIVFGAGVKHCEMLAEAIQRRGFSAHGVYAITKKAERDSLIERFKRKEIRCLLSVNALAVGFNAKHVDLIGLARPTQSTGLYIQICGRGTRPLYADGYDLDTADGRLAAMAAGPKPDCLVLDFGGNIKRHGFIDKPNVKTPGKGGGEMPMKACRVCGADNFIAARECSTCGAPFDIEGSKISTTAFVAPMLSIQQKAAEWVDVNKVTYSQTVSRQTNLPMLKVTYHCGLNRHNENVMLDHMGWPRSKAEMWWRQRSSGGIPGSVTEAMGRTGELRWPSQIQLKPDGKYINVVGARFI